MATVVAKWVATREWRATQEGELIASKIFIIGQFEINFFFLGFQKME